MTFGGVGILVSLASVCVACQGIGGTYDHSRSFARAGGVAGEGAVAVVGPPDTAELPGLAESIGSAVRDALAENNRGREVLGSGVFYARLQRHRGYLEHFGAWLARYAQTGYVERKYLPAYAKASGARYLVLLKDAAIRREKLDVRTAVEEANCGFGCFIGDASNIWGNRLIVVAELHDLSRGEIAWKGVGEANAITSRVSQLDFGLVQYNLKQPTMGAYSAQLVAHVANGIAREIGQLGRAGLDSRRPTAGR